MPEEPFYNIHVSNMHHTEVNESGAHHNMSLKHGSNAVTLLDLYLSGYILLPVCVIGIICNILVVIVLTRKSMRSSTNNFLLALAFFDTLLLICTCFIICFTSLSKVYNRHVFPRLLPCFYPLGLISQTCTIWITVSFTVERYIAVRHPLKASSMCTVKRARIICLAVAILSVFYNMPRWFELTYEQEVGHNDTEVIIPGTNLKSYVVKLTRLGYSRTYEWIYYIGLYLPVMCIIPIILLTILNAFLIKAVHKSRDERRNMGSVSSNKENNITVMLVSVVIVFIVCQLPALIYNVAFGVSKQHVMESTSWQILSIIRNFTVTTNSAVNFVLYCAFGQKFRKVFMKLFCAKLLISAAFQKYIGVSNGSTTTHIPNSGRKGLQKMWGSGSDYSRTSYTLVGGQSEATIATELTGDTAL